MASGHVKHAPPRRTSDKIKKLERTNRVLTIAVSGVCVVLIGVVAIISNKPVDGQASAGTCLPISKGGTGCDMDELKAALDIETISYSDVYPVGSIYTSVTNANPSSLFGGTWVAFGSGRTLVGVDTSDTIMDTAEETGGAKDAIVPYHNHTFTGTALEAHNHTQANHTHGGINLSWNSVGAGGGYFATAGSGGPAISSTWGTNMTGVAIQNADFYNTDSARAVNNAISAGIPAGTIGYAGTSDNATNANMQPYITVYFWKRTD